MKIQIFFKTPDTVDYAIDDLDLNEEKEDETRGAIEKWVKYNEAVTIEIDTETNTAVVLPA